MGRQRWTSNESTEKQWLWIYKASVFKFVEMRLVLQEVDGQMAKMLFKH